MAAKHVSTIETTCNFILGLLGGLYDFLNSSPTPRHSTIVQLQIPILYVSERFIRIARTLKSSARPLFLSRSKRIHLTLVKLGVKMRLYDFVAALLIFFEGI